MNSEIERIQKTLNSKEFSPKKGYRRDVDIYELVCYVNNITGCYLSGNSEPIRHFLSRARIYIDDNKKDETNKDYYELVTRYLKLMEEYLDNTV
jgi:hypothetical protein